MKKKLYKNTLTAAAVLSASLLLSACGAASSSPSASQASPVTQPIASSQSETPSASPEASVSVQPSSAAAETVPAQGESVAITAGSQTAAGTILTDAQAKQIAFDHAGVQEADVTGLRLELDYDDGRQEYEVEFYCGNTEYDYKIDASTGNILSFDNEIDYRPGVQQAPAGSQGAAGQTRQQNAGQTGQIAPEAVYSEDQAIQIALEQVPGATKDNVTKFKYDYDDGRALYEIEIRYNYSEWEIEIDATTGQIVKFEFDD